MSLRIKATKAGRYRAYEGTTPLGPARRTYEEASQDLDAARSDLWETTRDDNWADQMMEFYNGEPRDSQNQAA